MIIESRKFERIATILRAIGDPVRIQIIKALGRGEMYVTQLTEAIGASQANTSRHINMLYQVGIVTRRKSSNKVVYSVVEGRVFEILNIVDAIMGEQSHGIRAVTSNVLNRD
jgi:DNA-binding transcriptional ArsR family regulator